MNMRPSVSPSTALERVPGGQGRAGTPRGGADDERNTVLEDGRPMAVEHLRALLAEGLASGPPVPVDEAWFAEMRRRARTRRSAAE